MADLAWRPPREGDEAREDVLGNPDMLRILMAGLNVRDLCRSACVCRAWRAASAAPEFWRELRLDGAVTQPLQVASLVRCHPGIQDLSITGMREPLTWATATLIFSNLRQLRRLHIGRAQLSPDCLGAAAGQMPALREWRVSGAQAAGDDVEQPWHAGMGVAHAGVTALRFEGCALRRLEVRCPALAALAVTDGSLRELVLAAPRLTSLSLQGCVGFLESGVMPLVRQLPLLRQLDISGLHITDETMREVARTAGALERLTARGCACLHLVNVGWMSRLQAADFSACPSLTVASLEASLQQWPTLRELSLDGCTSLCSLGLTSASLERISLRGCHPLRRLSLDCPRLAAADLGGPLEGLQQLQAARVASTRLAALAWQGLPCLASVELRCPSLTSLDLSFCPELGDSVFAAADAAGCEPPRAQDGGGAPARGTCPALRHLVLDNCVGLREARAGGACLETLSLAGCKGLRLLHLAAPLLARLQLDECEQLRAVVAAPVGVARLSLGTCPRLRSLIAASPSLSSLDLRGCAELQEVRLHCPALEWLDCTYCQALPDGALGSLGGGAPRLAQLTLSVCRALRPGGLAQLRRLPALRLLDLSYTDIETLDPVLASCPQLQTLKLLSCQSLLPAALAPLLPAGGRPPALPALTHLDVSYCGRLGSADVAALLLGGARLQAVEVNGIEGLDTRVCAALGAGAGPPAAAAGAAAAPHALHSLSAKSCKALRAFWLGCEPPPEPGRHQQGPPRAPLAPLPLALLPTPLAGLRALRLGLSDVRSLSLALPQLRLLDASSCGELWRLRLACPALQEAHFQSCRHLPAAAVVGELLGSSCRQLTRLGLPGEADPHLLQLLLDQNEGLHIVPSPAAGLLPSSLAGVL